MPGLIKEDAHSPILIIGAGLGGLALGQALKRASIPFHIYERDPSSGYRPQGYRLKINPDGAAAIRSVLPVELWNLFEQTCAMSTPGETDFNAISGSITASRAGMGKMGKAMGRVYTCDRTVLRGILMTGLEENMSFGKTLERYKATDDEGVHAFFSDSTTATGRLLVGADGVRSAVRKQMLPKHKPLDTEGCCIYGKTPLTPELEARFPARALRWMTLCTDSTPMTQTLDVDGAPLTLLLEPIRFPRSAETAITDAVVAPALPHDYVYWVLISRKSAFGATDADLSHLLRMTPDESAALSLQMTAEWDPAIRSLLELQDITQSSTLRVCSANPEMEAWAASGRVTLIGDAVHVMSPCGGVGAVTALKDAAVLARELVDGGIGRESVERFEESMRVYAGQSIKRSFFGGKMMFAQRPFAECAELSI